MLTSLLNVRAAASTAVVCNPRLKGFTLRLCRLANPNPKSFRNSRSTNHTRRVEILAFKAQDTNRIESPEVRKERMSRGEANVADVMSTAPVVLEVEMPIKDAVKVLLASNISGAPVVDKAGKLVGMLSESDLMWKGAGSPQDHYIIPPVMIGFADLLISWRDNAKIEEEIHKILAKTVQEAMTRDPISVKPSTSMSDAAALMLKKQVNRLPVVEGGKVVGVVTRHDILQGIVASNSPLL